MRVGQLALRLAEHIQSGDEFKDLWVEGEVVQSQVSSAGHVYFTLRDQVGQLGCVLFQTQASQIALTPRDGTKLIAHGYVEYYHRTRTHLSLDKDCPDPRPIQPRRIGSVVAIPQVGGLHHRYERLAA